jgi:hypothetical protein
MASGNYARRTATRVPTEPQTVIPPRATRELQTIVVEEEDHSDSMSVTTRPVTLRNKTKALEEVQLAERYTEPVRPSTRSTTTSRSTTYRATNRTRDLYEDQRPRRVVIDAVAPDPIEHHRPWIKIFIGSVVAAVIFAVVLISAGLAQRPGLPQLITNTGGGVYSIQVGGADAKSWQEKEPMPAKTPIPTKTGPYGVLGKPTISVAFINQVLASYHSPAAGKGQALYDLGVKYGIDPAFALAFFQHESTFGTAGEARTTMSLGNLRCIPDRPCVDQDRGGYAQMQSWEDGFEIWYQLIRNYYIARRGLITVEQIIPVYAPAADSNNELAYISSLKHSIDTWHAGMLRP